MIRNFSRHDASAVKYVLWPAGSTLFGRTVSQRFPPLTPSHRSVCTTGLVRANIVSPHIKGKQPNKYSLWKTKGHVDNDHKETKKCPDKNKLLWMAYKYTKRKLFLKYFVANGHPQKAVWRIQWMAHFHRAKSQSKIYPSLISEYGDIPIFGMVRLRSRDPISYLPKYEKNVKAPILKCLLLAIKLNYWWVVAITMFC